MPIHPTWVFIAALIVSLSEYASDAAFRSPSVGHTTDPALSSATPQPYNASPYFDARLERIKIGNWTTVPVTDAAAARVLSLYLATDHCIVGFFDADLFLNALVSGDRRFCSPLLVNALLSWACVCLLPSWEVEVG